MCEFRWDCVKNNKKKFYPKRNVSVENYSQSVLQLKTICQRNERKNVFPSGTIFKRKFRNSTYGICSFNLIYAIFWQKLRHVFARCFFNQFMYDKEHFRQYSISTLHTRLNKTFGNKIYTFLKVCFFFFKNK